jgi:hypothetical protein
MEKPLILNKAQQNRLKEAISDDKKPEVLLFRILGPQLQDRFTQMMNLDGVPQLLLHGNPHLDNYARTHNGAGLLDFDRSRIGPSLWDITRALTSITFWSAKDKVIPNNKVATLLFDSYVDAIEDRLKYWQTPDFLRQVKPKKFQLTAQQYLASGKKWVKKLQQNLVDPSDQLYEGLYAAYLATLPKNSLIHWTLAEVAEVSGSMGKKHFVYLLQPTIETREPILLDIKETYTEVDNEFFYNPFDHEGERMVAASRIYSPGLEEGIGFCTYDGEDYWVRQIPTFSAKVPVGLSHDEALQLGKEIGTQLGRGHRVIDEIYTDGALKDDLIRALKDHQSQLIEVCVKLNQSVLDCYAKYKSILQ